LTKRSDILTDFIAQSGWSDADSKVIAGDASNRRYLRLTRPNGASAILMDAPPDKGEDVRPFIHIAEVLTDQGLSAPQIMHRDIELGLLIIEDLGDDLFARILKTSPELENSLYSAATDVLVSLHDTAPPSGLEPYSIPMMADMAALACDWYADGLDASDPVGRQRLKGAMTGALALLDGLEDVLIQRDYHAENLLWLPERSGKARVGLLDFQDAMRGHRAYDLVSLLQDARRDVSPQVESDMIKHYVTAWGGNPAAFNTAYHVLGAQRNLRIIGVFARLCLRDGKAHYVDFIPRVWDYLMRDLHHAALGPLLTVVQDVLPHPSESALQRLRAKCATQLT